MSGFGPGVVLVCGSRAWTNRDMIYVDIFGLTKGSIVVHGGQGTPEKGADMIADSVARELGFHVARVDALWDFYGKSAGPRRNEAMGLLRPSFALAYPLGGPGTRDMISRLKRWEIPTYIRGPFAQEASDAAA